MEISGTVPAGKNSDDIALSFDVSDEAGNGLEIASDVATLLGSQISVNSVPEAEGFADQALVSGGSLDYTVSFTDADAGDTLDYLVSVVWSDSGTRRGV